MWGDDGVKWYDGECGGGVVWCDGGSEGGVKVGVKVGVMVV